MNGPGPGGTGVGVTGVGVTGVGGAAPVEVADALGDIGTRTDIHDLVVEFYREVVFDEVLEPMFGEVAEVDWGEHIPKLVDYWCRILLRTDEYSGPIMAAHRELHGRSPVTAEHCDRWFALWTRCVDAGWRGPVADHAKAHAESIMGGMSRHIFGGTWTSGDIRF